MKKNIIFILFFLFFIASAFSVNAQIVHFANQTTDDATNNYNLIGYYNGQRASSTALIQTYNQFINTARIKIDASTCPARTGFNLTLTIENRSIVTPTGLFHSALNSTKRMITTSGEAYYEVNFSESINLTESVLLVARLDSGTPYICWDKTSTDVDADYIAGKADDEVWSSDSGRDLLFQIGYYEALLPEPPPVININYPILETSQGWVSGTCDSINSNIASIKINDSRFINLGNATNFYFNSSLKFESNFTVLINCTDYNNLTTTINKNLFLDNYAPRCDGINNEELNNGTITNWLINCTDNNLFSFNQTCSNGFIYYKSEINNKTYTYTNSSYFYKNSQCIFIIYDGHTAEKLPKTFKPTKEKNKIKVENIGGINELSPYSNKENSIINYTKNIDRINIQVSYKDKPKKKLKTKDTYTFHYRTTKNSYYIPDKKYKGWIVDTGSKTWFDANLKNDPLSEADVMQLNKTHWLVTVRTYNTFLDFESIGALNKAEFKQNITILNNQTEAEEPEAEPSISLEETNNLIERMFLLIAWLVLLVLTITIKGTKGKTIQFFNILQMLFGFVGGLAWIPHYFLIGFPILLSSIGFFLVYITEK